MNSAASDDGTTVASPPPKVAKKPVKTKWDKEDEEEDSPVVRHVSRSIFIFELISSLAPTERLGAVLGRRGGETRDSASCSSQKEGQSKGQTWRDRSEESGTGG